MPQTATTHEENRLKEIMGDEGDRTAAAPALKIRHDWYQTESQVILSVMVKNVHKQDVNLDVSDRKFKLTVALPSGEEYRLDLDLAHSVCGDQTNIRLSPSKIEIKLKKADAIRWEKLESTEPESDIKQISSSASSASSQPMKYPSSTKKPKDWDKVAVDISKEIEEDKTEGDAALNELFQKIYADGTDETKRAMMKSFSESGGTVLSTNWNEVGKDKVEVKPPDGMEYRKWEA